MNSAYKIWFLIYCFVEDKKELILAEGTRIQAVGGCYVYEVNGLRVLNYDRDCTSVGDGSDLVWVH